MTDRAISLARKHYEMVRFARSRFHLSPILGGALQIHNLAIATPAALDFPRDGEFYFVVEISTRCPITYGRTKAEALAQARESVTYPDYDAYIGEYRRLAREDEALIAGFIRGLERRHGPGFNEEPCEPKKVPKRRLAIFERSQGKCHYCAASLDLHGKWHIEHKMPRALMGGNEPTNLVASCVPCNLKKRDRTDLEFASMREQAEQLEIEACR